jgi:trans-aconitate methyltransferase
MISIDDIYIDDNDAERMIQYIQRQSDHLGITISGKVVDLGCGDGKVLHRLKQKYPHIIAIGVDRSPIDYLMILNTIRKMSQKPALSQEVRLLF